MSSLWFARDKVPFIDGLLATAVMIGAVCGQLPLSMAVNHFGWREAMFGCAMIGFVLAILFWFFVTQNSNMVIQPDKAVSEKLSWHHFRSLLKKKQNWLLMLYSGFAFTPLAVFGSLWGNPFFETVHNLTAREAASLSSFVFIGFGLGSPLFGWIAGKINDQIGAMLIGTALSLISLLLVIYLPTSNCIFLATLLLLFGLGTGAFMACFSVGKGVNHLLLGGTIVALINMGDPLIGSITEPLIGKLLDLSWTGTIVNGAHQFPASGFYHAFSILPFYIFVAIVCLLVLRNKVKR
jgi:cyanate permease